MRTKIFNDGDAFRVITTCLFIMLSYWRASCSNLCILCELQENLNSKSSKDGILHYSNTRFRIYQYAMLNLFPPAKFIQLRDSANCLYVLLNKKQKKPKTTLKRKWSCLSFGKLRNDIFTRYYLISHPQPAISIYCPPNFYCGGVVELLAGVAGCFLSDLSIFLRCFFPAVSHLHFRHHPPMVASIWKLAIFQHIVEVKPFNMHPLTILPF